jgi:hypothetical protein
LGLCVGVITSVGPDFELGHVLNDALITSLPAAATTTFENIYTSGGRHQVLHSRAETLTSKVVPSDWHTPVVHLGPVARECDPSLVDAFGDGFVGVTPQGWMRCWDQTGRVSHCLWEGAPGVLSRADAVVLSLEDVAGDESLVAQYTAQTQVLVVTEGAGGCTVYAEGRSRHFPAPDVDEVDPTGAGDVFATVFFVDLQRNGDPWQAARFANCVAAHSVMRAGLASTPGPEEIAHCRRHLEE